MIVAVGVRKVTISLDPDLYAAIKADTESKETSVSSWLSDAAAEKLRRQAMDQYLAAYQEEFGEFTEDELNAPLPVAYVSGKKQAS